MPFTPRHAPLTLAIVAALAPAAPHAFAAENGVTLKPVVVTGSRVEAESFDVPFSVDVVDMAEVQRGNLGVNASEALASVPGLVVQNRQNYAQDLQISSRGFGARAAFGVRGIKLITDGIPASIPDGQGQAATFNLDTAERIEVLRGPFSTIYGASSGGVIQLFSRDGKGRPSVSGGVIAGSWDTTKVNLGAEGEAGGVGYLLDLSRFDTEGYRDHSAATRDQGFAKLTFRPGDDSKLSLIANGLEQNETEDPLGVTFETFKDDPRAVEDVAEQFNTRKSIHHKQGGVNYERRFGAGRLQLTGYAGDRSVIQYLGFKGNGVVDFDREFNGLGARWIHTLAVGAGELTVTGGVDYDRSEDDRQGFKNFIGPFPAPTALGVKGALSRDETDTITSLDPYLQASWKLDKWMLQAGIRHSNVKFEVDDAFLSDGDGSGDVTHRKTTPAVGITYQLTPAVNLYASAAKGFETPTLTELSYSGPTGEDGFNFGLKPARSRQVELGAKAFVGESTRVNAAIFQIRTEDEIVVESNTGGRSVFRNAGKTLRRGFELAVDSEFSRQWRGRLAVTRLHAIYDSDFVTTIGGVPTTIPDGNYLPGIPATSAFGELAWTPRQGVTAALEAVYRSKVYVEDTNTKRTAPAHTLVNLRLSAEQTAGGWTFGQLLRLDNLFDREYIGSVIVGASGDRFYEPGPERSWYAGARASYRF